MIHIMGMSSDLLHSHGTPRKNFFYLGKLPLLVAEGTGTSSLEPPLNAVKVENMTTVSPGNTQTRMISIASGISLILNARLI